MHPSTSVSPLLIIFFSGCGAPLLNGPAGTSTIGSGHPEPVIWEIDGPFDFYVYGFAAIQGNTAQHIAAYGLDPQSRPILGIYDASLGWLSVRVADEIAEVSDAFLAERSDGSIGALLTLYTQGVRSVIWAEFDGRGWLVGTPPTPLPFHTANGVAFVDNQWYAAVTGPQGVALWHKNASTWTQDVAPPNAVAVTLSGNATHLHFCILDNLHRITFASRDVLGYDIEVVQDRNPGLTGSLRCLIGEQSGDLPILAWFAPRVALDDMYANLYGAFRDQGRWNVSLLPGGNDPRPEQIVSTIANGTYLYVKESDVLRLSNQHWVACSVSTDGPNGEPHIPGAVGIVGWGDDAVLATFHTWPDSHKVVLRLLSAHCDDAPNKN